MIRVGVVGYGSRIHSFIHHALRQEGAGDLRVVAVVDPDEAGVRSRLADEDRDARFFSSVEMMMRQARPDAVLIGTRCNLHADYAIQMAAYDVPLFVEKPVAISEEQALELEEVFAHGSAPPTLVSFPLRTSPLCRLVREHVVSGAVGMPRHVTATNYVPYGTTYWEEEYRNYSITGGLFLQKATHDFDYLMYLLDSPIVRVSAHAQYGGVFGGDKAADLRCSACEERHVCRESPENRRKNRSGGTLNDHLCVFSAAAGTEQTGTNENSSNALVEFASGAHGVYAQVFYSRRDAARRGAVISGYEGTLDFDWYRNNLIHVRHHAPFTGTVTAAEGLSHFGGDAELARNFVAMIERREPSAADMLCGIRSVHACLAARESAQVGRAVTVRQVGK